MLVEAVRVLVEAVRVLVDPVRVPLESLRLLPFWCSQNRNQSTNVSISKLRIETKPKRFDMFQKFFLAKVERFYLFQKFWNKTKTFWCFFSKSKTFLFIQKFLEQNQNFFDVFQLYFSKSKTFLFDPKT